MSKKYDVEMLTLALHFAFLPDVVNYVSIGVRDAEKAKANVELFTKILFVVLLSILMELGFIQEVMIELSKFSALNLEKEN